MPCSLLPSLMPWPSSGRMYHNLILKSILVWLTCISPVGSIGNQQPYRCDCQLSSTEVKNSSSICHPRSHTQCGRSKDVSFISKRLPGHSDSLCPSGCGYLWRMEPGGSENHQINQPSTSAEAGIVNLWNNCTPVPVTCYSAVEGGMPACGLYMYVPL